MALARWTGLVQDGQGNAVSGALVEVRSEDSNALVPLFSDRAGTVAIGNPFTSADAMIAFHVAGGSYRITASKGTYERTWRYVGIGTASELDAESLQGQIDEALNSAVRTIEQELSPEQQEQALLNLGASFATAPELRSGAPSKVVIASVSQAAMAWVAGPANAATMTFNHRNGVRQTATATAARTITASNLIDGLPFVIVFTGNYAHSYSTSFFDFTEIGGVPTSVWARYKVAGTVRNGKVRVYSVVETSA